MVARSSIYLCEIGTHQMWHQQVSDPESHAMQIVIFRDSFGLARGLGLKVDASWVLSVLPEHLVSHQPQEDASREKVKVGQNNVSSGRYSSWAS